MKVRVLGAAIMVGMAAACGTVEDEPPVAETPIGEDAALAPDQDQVAVACAPMTGNMALDGRASPYDSVTVSIGGEEAKLCYGRPSMRDRDIYGGLVPYDTLWRTGANEPTTIHLPFPAEIAGLQVEPGSYSIYTVPGQDEWEVIVNRSTEQWGIESQYTDEIRAQEVGRASVPAESVDEPVEMFTISAEEAGAQSAELVLDWETTRVRIPIERV